MLFIDKPKGRQPTQMEQRRPALCARRRASWCEKVARCLRASVGPRRRPKPRFAAYKSRSQRAKWSETAPPASACRRLPHPCTAATGPRSRVRLAATGAPRASTTQPRRPAQCSNQGTPLARARNQLAMAQLAQEARAIQDWRARPATETIPDWQGSAVCGQSTEYIASAPLQLESYRGRSYWARAG